MGIAAKTTDKKGKKARSHDDHGYENIFERWIQDIRGDKPPARLLRTSDPKLRERAGMLYRGLGFIVCVIILYLLVFDFFKQEGKVIYWLAGYFMYLLFLELVRFRRKDLFDGQAFRAIRIFLNILALSALVAISSGAQAITSLFLTIPIFAAIIYFPEHKPAIAGTLLFSILGLLIAGRLALPDPTLGWTQILLITVVLSIFSYASHWFQRNVIFGTDLISQVAVRLHKTLNLQELASSIIEISLELANADRALVIIIDGRNGEYIKHAESGFELRENRSIVELAKKCSVLNSGDPFNCPELSAYYEKDIYSGFFKCRPESVISVPLFNKEGGVIGVLNVASDLINRFDNTTKDLMLGFSYIVSSAVENSLVHRQIKLREIRSKTITRDFARALDEREIFNLILNEIKAALPDANCVIHRLEKVRSPANNAEDEILNPYIWDASNYNTGNGRKPSPARFRLGHGLAGQALKFREPILANNVNNHPLYVKQKSDKDIRSLLVCPLFDPNGLANYGTISVFKGELNGFSQDDEFALTSLAHQASLAISKIREFQEWQEQGGILRKILAEVRFFDFGASEHRFCSQIAEAATKLLNFKMARIRLLDVKNDQLTTVAVAGVPGRVAKKLIGHKMPYSALEPFIDQQYQAERSYIIPHNDRRWKEIADKYFYVPKNNSRKRTEWKAYDAILTPMVGPSGQIIGLLSLDVPNDREYPSRNLVEPIGLFASMAGWAIELSRYQRRFIDQKDRAKSFMETISDELAQGHNYQTLGEVVVQIGAKLINAEGCNLFIVKENEIELTHSSYLAGTDYIGRRKPICDDPGCGLTGWVVVNRTLLLYNDESYKEDPCWAGETSHLRHLPSQECKSVLIVPVMDSENNVLGVLSLENKRRYSEHVEFDEEDVRRVKNLANQLAEALVRIGKFEAIKKWESKGLEDDLHFLINWYRFGVLARIEQLEGAVYRNDLEKAREVLPELIRNARNSVNELKALHTMIINECLEANNIKEGLERLIDAWRKRVVPVYKENLPMQIKLVCPEDLEVGTALRNTMLRIASEALSNSIFHSGIIETPSIQIRISVIARGSRITLKVIDNGMGTKSLREGVGIDRMRQLTRQVNSWGGIVSDIEIDSSPKKGTSVIFTATYKK